MKKGLLKKWLLRSVATCMFILALLAGIVLNPIFLYAKCTLDGNYKVFHQRPLEMEFMGRLGDAKQLIETSELYDSTLQLSFCLNDGSLYPTLMRWLRGPAFGWGFEKKVVLMGTMNAKDNYVALNGYRYNLTELLAHEAVHCFQFRRYGLLHSKPLANIPEWKWEGYPEYVARRKKADLLRNISLLQEVEARENNNWIIFADGTGTVIPYYKYWLLTQYCMDLRHLTFDQLIKDTTSERTAMENMMRWYNVQAKVHPL